MTKIFLDTANMEEIKEISSWGIIEGLTTNQKIFLNEKGCNFKVRAKEILEFINPYPVSLEGPNDYEGIINFATDTEDWVDRYGIRFSNIVFKVPMLGNGDGLKAVKTLTEMRCKTNVTACMTLNQTFLAASAGATYVSLFYNRMKDMKGKEYALTTIKQTMDMLHSNCFNKTQLICGSIRKPEDIIELVSVCPDIITIPTKILKQMPFNEMTESTLKEFENAWKEFKKYEK